MPTPHPRSRLAAALLTVAVSLVVTACGPQPSRSSASLPPGEEATPTPVGGPSGEPAGQACDLADLELLHGRVEGAAGSRYTTVELANRGASRCDIPAAPGFELIDAAGATIAATTPSGHPGVLAVDPEELVASDVQLGDWCAPAPAAPVTLALRLDGGLVIVGGGPFPGPGELPPCMGGALVFAADAWRPG